jgi:hypothetical protein
MPQKYDLCTYRRGSQVGWKQTSLRGSLENFGSSTDIWLACITAVQATESEDEGVFAALAWLGVEVDEDAARDDAALPPKPAQVLKEDFFHRVTSVGSSLGDENSSAGRTYSAGSAQSSCCDRSSPLCDGDHERIAHRSYMCSDENIHVEELSAGSENSERDNNDGKLGARSVFSRSQIAYPHPSITFIFPQAVMRFAQPLRSSSLNGTPFSEDSRRCPCIRAF